MAELTRRYIVMQMAAEGPFDIADPDAPFVLKPWKDPAALQALIAYREHCYAELAQELDQWIRVIVAGPKIRGGVGSRNELTAPARRKSAAAAKPKAKSKAKSSKHSKKKVKRRA
jgi:hypothetical protein